MGSSTPKSPSPFPADTAPSLEPLAPSPPLGAFPLMDPPSPGQPPPSQPLGSASLSPCSIDPIKFFLTSTFEEGSSTPSSRPSSRHGAGSRGKGQTTPGRPGRPQSGNPVIRELGQLEEQEEAAWGRSQSEGGSYSAARLSNPILQELEATDDSYGRSTSVDAVGRGLPGGRRPPIQRQGNPILRELEKLGGGDLPSEAEESAVDVLADLKRVQPKQCKQRNLLRRSTSPLRFLEADSSEDEEEGLSQLDEEDDGSSSDGSGRDGVFGIQRKKTKHRGPSAVAVDSNRLDTGGAPQPVRPHKQAHQVRFPSRSGLSINTGLAEPAGESEGPGHVRAATGVPQDFRKSTHHDWLPVDNWETAGEARGEAGTSGMGDDSTVLRQSTGEAVLTPLFGVHSPVRGYTSAGRPRGMPLGLPSFQKLMVSPRRSLDLEGHGGLGGEGERGERKGRTSISGSVSPLHVSSNTGGSFGVAGRKFPAPRGGSPISKQDPSGMPRMQRWSFFEGRNLLRRQRSAAMGALGAVQRSESSLEANPGNAGKCVVEQGFASPVHLGVSRFGQPLDVAECN